MDFAFVFLAASVCRRIQNNNKTSETNKEDSSYKNLLSNFSPNISMARKDSKKTKDSDEPSQQDVFQVKINHDELAQIMKTAKVLRKKDQKTKKIRTKMKELAEDSKNPNFAIMMHKLFPMANLSLHQLDRRDPLKSLQNLCKGFEKSLKQQKKLSLKIADKIDRETELLQTLKTLLRNKTDNMKLKAENSLLKQKRELLLADKKYLNMPALKKLRLTKLKEELEETDQQASSVLDQNAKLFKDIENLHRDKQKKLKYESDKRELRSFFLRRRYCKEVYGPKYLRRKNHSKKKML